MLDRFFEQGGNAWIDLPTNFTSLPAFREPEDVNGLLENNLPLDKAPVFLHEMTHHWCFNSPLGIALTLLKARLQENLIRVVMGEDVEEFDILDDIIRYKVTVELLRPITEGLALLAEHDVRPEGPFFYSAPITNLAVLNRRFLPLPETGAERPIVLSQDDLSSAVTSGLDALRRSDHGIQRKADLLSSPLDFKKKVYLGGYLAVRNLWFMKWLETKGLTSDKFLSYCRTYFFCDYGLINAILADGHEAQLLNRIGKYIYDRVRLLITSDLTAPLAAWDAHEEDQENNQLLTFSDDGSVTPMLPPPDLPGLLTDQGTESAGHCQLLEEMKRLQYSVDDHLVVQGIRFSALVGLALRSLMPVTSLPVVVEDGSLDTAVAENGCEFGPFRPLDETMQPGKYLLEYFHLPIAGDSVSKLVVLMAEDQVVAVLEIGEVVTSQFESFFSHLRPNENQRRSLARMRSFETEMLASERLKIIDFSLSALRIEEILTENMRNIYAAPLSYIFSDDSWEEQISKMGQAGFFDLFERDYNFFQKFAAFTVWASRLESAEEVRSNMKLDGREWKKFLELLNAQEARLGARFIHQFEELVGATV